MDNDNSKAIVAEYLRKAKKRMVIYFSSLFVGLLAMILAGGTKPFGKYFAIAIGVRLIFHTFYIAASVSTCPVCGKPFRDRQLFDYSWRYIPYDCPHCGVHIRDKYK